MLVPIMASSGLHRANSRVFHCYASPVSDSGVGFKQLTTPLLICSYHLATAYNDVFSR